MIAGEALAPLKLVAGETAEPKTRHDAPNDEWVVQLTSRLYRGDENAWMEFHQLYASRLLRYLWVVTGGREEAASEAMQHTWLRCVRHMRCFPSEKELWSWLTVVARSSAIDDHRRQSRFVAFVKRWWAGAPATSTDEGPTKDYDGYLLQLLEEEMECLKPEERILVKGKYLEHRSTRALAGELNTTEKAVESRLARLRQKLKAAVLLRLQRHQFNEDE
jgi:RNA polymerase sigma-70 factor (ECF subfamily)